MSKNISPDTIIGHHRILSKIGAGGMAEVYLARDFRTRSHGGSQDPASRSRQRQGGWTTRRGKKILDKLKSLSSRRDVPSIAPTFAYMVLDQKEEAIKMLQKEVEERGYWATSFAVQPELDEFHSGPLFL